MTLEVMRDDLLMLIRDELQIDHCTLIGHSLGGRVAMVTALSQVYVCLEYHQLTKFAKQIGRASVGKECQY